MRLLGISLITFGLALGLVAGCEAVQRAGQSYSEEWQSGNLQRRGLDHLGNFVENPSPINGIAQVGSFLSYLATIGLGGLLVRNAKSDARKKAIEDRLGGVDSAVKSLATTVAKP
jgi:hypothetical protein